MNEMQYEDLKLNNMTKLKTLRINDEEKLIKRKLNLKVNKYFINN
jgi:hypothetical protein